MPDRVSGGALADEDRDPGTPTQVRALPQAKHISSPFSTHLDYLTG